jgi:GTP pyrophosphokinase
MVVAMARDPRVLVIKLSDRLHNMRTMRFLSPEKQAKKARETLEVMAPLAHRLGMATVKWELEDLSFAILHPKKYSEIVRLVATRAPSRDTYLKQVIDEVRQQLDAARLTNVSVEGRPKHYYSIYRKMIVKGRDFDDIHDLVGVRVLVDEVRDCYAAIGMVHALWQPMPGRFKDYIAQPRFGVYQSLHTTVIGPDGKPLEVQIRTHDMHSTAEYGIAAHWRYKETPRTQGSASVEIDEMSWMRQLLDWQREAADPGDFLEQLRYDLGAQQIFVFTPKGDVITLPAKSTPVDFAYAVHTEVGHRCIGSRVNGRSSRWSARWSPATSSRSSRPRRRGRARAATGWRSSPHRGPKTKIKQWFAKERREEAIEAGQGRDRAGGAAHVDAVAAAGVGRRDGRACPRAALPGPRRAVRRGGGGARQRAARHPTAHGAARRRGAGGGGPGRAGHAVHDAAALRGRGGRGRAGPRRRRRRSLHEARAVLHPGARATRSWASSRAAAASPCTGWTAPTRATCAAASERIVDVAWSVSPGSVFLVAIQAEALDRHRLLSDITKVLADEKVNILSASVATSKDRVAISRFSFEMGDPKHLGHVLSAVRNVEGVYDVYRVTSAG